jgi:ZIP family zinc transporter
VTVWTAVAWGLATSAALFLGQALARPLSGRYRITGLVMGFGAGTLLSAVAYQLVPIDGIGNGVQVGLGVAAGALTYYIADALVDRGGGATRQQIKPELPADTGSQHRTGTDRQDATANRSGGDAGAGGGSGLAMFLGALLDGLPEAFVLGIGMGLGGEVSAAFVMAVFVSNVPQGIAGTASMQAAGWSQRGIAGLWGALTVVCGAAAGLGFVSADMLAGAGAGAEAFAAGALLMVLADSMIPEAYTHGGRAVGLATVGGYLVATALAVAA